MPVDEAHSGCAPALHCSLQLVMHDRGNPHKTSEATLGMLCATPVPVQSLSCDSSFRLLHLGQSQQGAVLTSLAWLPPCL